MLAEGNRGAIIEEIVAIARRIKVPITRLPRQDLSRVANTDAHQGVGLVPRAARRLPEALGRGGGDRRGPALAGGLGASLSEHGVGLVDDNGLDLRAAEVDAAAHDQAFGAQAYAGRVTNREPATALR